MPKKHRLDKPLWKYAENHANMFIAGYGLERAEIVAKLTLHKIRARTTDLLKKYGVEDGK
jgi:hypothetical protein